MAALVIGIFAGYMAFQMREGAQAVGEYPLYAQARGEETVVSPSAGSKNYVVYFDKTWEGDYASLRTVVRDASGAEKLSVPLESGAPGEGIHIKIPTRKLASGKYVLVMMGSNAGKETELARFPYTLKIK